MCLYTGDVGDYVDRYRHIHGSKPVMIPVDQLVLPREGTSTVGPAKLHLTQNMKTG